MSLNDKRILKENTLKACFNYLLLEVISTIVHYICINKATRLQWWKLWIYFSIVASSSGALRGPGWNSNGDSQTSNATPWNVVGRQPGRALGEPGPDNDAVLGGWGAGGGNSGGGGSGGGSGPAPSGWGSAPGDNRGAPGSWNRYIHLILLMNRLCGNEYSQFSKKA